MGRRRAGGAPRLGRHADRPRPRLRTTAPVAAISTFLAGLAPETLSRRYDPAAIAASEIYWTESTKPENAAAELATLWEAAVALRDFFAETARRGDSVLVEIY